MKFWPFGNEKREVSYSDEVIGYLLRQAGGQVGEVAETAALEVAAGLFGRTFASATVVNGGLAADALTAPVLELVGRELIRKGEAAFEIVIDGGMVRLDPLASWTVTGDCEPSSWTYEATASGPSRTRTTRGVPGTRIVHCRYACSPSSPWRGAVPDAGRAGIVKAHVQS